ncbi:A disintegrin and metalloproteinase with thrombospondin motifs 2-like [Trichogramma pretiosum]|uniref:A disintegrin and metalloproteinase with thrombospondin motifs 2-like n=1 Tax=Trichogramma pretiosum TaxID=7493 RepID=UPI0006C987AD|nr:A disintegrin and metalloproteinase with thrombospondin motifs 2-like [Trichogramma pretiosum]
MPSCVVLTLVTLLIAAGCIASTSLHYPRIVHPRVIPSAELSRDRRSLHHGSPLKKADQDDEDALYVSLHRWILKTQPNRRLLFSSDFQVQWAGDSRQNSSSLDSCESREGRIQGKEARSQVILTRCRDDFFGLIILDSRTYLIEPLTQQTASGGEHLLYEADYARVRRDLAGDFQASLVYESSDRTYYNLTGDTFARENYDETPNLLKQSARLESRNNRLDGVVESSTGSSSTYDDHDYYLDPFSNKKSTSTSPKMTGQTNTSSVSSMSASKWLELAIVADYSVIDFHGSRVQQYLLALLNIVSAIYQDPSLDANMQVVVSRMILYSDKKDSMVHQGNARRSLENVNKWNRKLLASDSDDVTASRHDVAVWLTRLDIGGPSGYAPVSGACDPARSCALNRDEGFTSAFIIAHEVAHILGLSHDGDKNAGNSCAREAARGSIMAPMVAATFHNFYWSTCSRKEFQRRAKLWTCLDNQPEIFDENHPQVKPSNEVFGMDEQCRMEFGDGYSRCKNLESTNLCSHLWCGRVNSTMQACKTKKGPPLEGTICAENKWCVNGSCEPIDRARYDPKPLLARGSAENTWSSWSECSRTCGVAVQHRHRRCDADCKNAREFRICRDLPECEDRIDLRARQCLRFVDNVADSTKKSSYYQARNQSSGNAWIPHVPQQGTPSCRLVCYNRDSGEIFHTGLNVEDGTPCSYDSSDVCIDGICRPMGCDRVLGSGRKRDACGRCAGDNSTCEVIGDKFQRKLRRETTRLAVIPKFAYNIKIVVTILLVDSIPHEGNMKILIRDSRRKRHEISNFDSEGRAPIMVIEGAAFRIERLEEKYVLWSRGPTSSEIVVSLSTVKSIIRGGASISTSSQFTIERGKLSPSRGKYSWFPDSAEACSAQCGGGTRKRHLVCRDTVKRELVSRRRCLLIAKPPNYTEIESCNAHSCEYTWIAGSWERCTYKLGNTCASSGIQQRSLYCVRRSLGIRQVTHENELKVYRNTLPPLVCRDQPQPETVRSCGGQKNYCPGQWVYSDWSPCSKNCGRGIQKRKARCITKPSNNNVPHYKPLLAIQPLLLDACNATRAPDEIRTCRVNYGCGSHRQSPPTTSWICQDDEKIFCASKNLKVRCKNAAFRKRCCHSCKSGK